MKTFIENALNRKNDSTDNISGQQTAPDVQEPQAVQQQSPAQEVPQHGRRYRHEPRPQAP